MTRFLAIVLSCTALPVLAQELPVLADVTGVAANDVLNIRAVPNAGGAIIGTLAPDATGVEVMAIEGDWALVNSNEGAGYAAMRFLDPDESTVWYDLELQPLACSGTEPFWGLDIDPVAGTTVFWVADPSETQAGTMGDRWIGQPWAQSAAFSLPDRLVVLQPQACSDGMSDRAFGIGIDIFLTDSQGARYSGCCSLIPR